jgi:hypothetical protein
MKKLLSIFIIVLIVVSTINVPTASAQQAIDPAFNPNLLITDTAFGDAGTFGSAAAVQKFLVQQNSPLASTTPDFISKLKEPTSTVLKQGLEDPNPNLDRLRTAAELIYDSSAKTGLNPQVILVTLQKEQSLILGNFSSSSDLQRALDRAMGFGCPDSAPCGAIFLGFYYQLFGNFDASGERYLGAAASLMKSFNYIVDGVRVGRGPEIDANGSTSGGPAVRTARLGYVVNFDNTLGGFMGVPASQPVTLQSFATAALYRYTPHVFNGNYNFWRYYTLWFKYPNGTVIQRIGDTGLFLIDNGTKRLFSQFVAAQRKIKLNQIVGVSPTEFDSYITESQLTPLDGTLFKGDAEATVYIATAGVKQPISGPIFSQRKLSFKKVVTLPQAEVTSYGTGTFLAPLEGTLITGNTDKTVYVIENGLKRPISASVFAARKMSFRNLMKLSDNEVAGIGTGAFLTPPDAVQIQLSGDSGIYWYKDGQKRFVSAFTYKQRGVGNFPRIALGGDEFNAIPTGTPLPPKDGTVIKGDASDGIYQVSGGLKHLLTPVSYKRLKYPKPNILPQGEIDSYAEGEVIAK